MAAINFPAGVKIRGINILSLFPTGVGVDTMMGSNFHSEWYYLRRSIDYAYSLGCNAIRMVGEMEFVHSGSVSQATYDAHWAILLDYTDSLGLYVYPCMQGANEIAAQGLSVSDMVTSISASLAAMAGRTRIIGVDLVNEGNSPDTLSAANAILLLDGVRANGTAFPLTISTYENFLTAPLWFNDGGVEAHVDFADFHIYRSVWGSTIPTAAHVTNGPFTWWHGLDVLFGEFGDPKSQGTTNNTAWINACVAASNVADANGCHAWGGFLWNIYDQSTTSTNQWGAFDRTWAAYTPATLPLVKSTAAAAGPATPPTPIAASNGAIMVNPGGCSTDYSGVKFYRDAGLVATVAHGYLDDSANVLPGVKYFYTAKITTASNGDSAASSPLAWSMQSSRAR